MKKIFSILLITTNFLFSYNKEKMMINGIYLGSFSGSNYDVIYLDKNNYIYITLQPEYGKSVETSEKFSTTPYGTICKMVINRQKITYDLSRSGHSSPHSQYNYTIDSFEKTNKQIKKLFLTGIIKSAYLPENGRKIELNLLEINKKNVLAGYNLSPDNVRWILDSQSLSKISDEIYSEIAKIVNNNSNLKIKVNVVLILETESYRNVYASREEEREKIHYRYYWKVENIKKI